MSSSIAIEKSNLAIQDGRLKEEHVAASLATEDSFTNPTGINENALVRRLDWKLLPPLTILYLLSFLDRSNSM